MKQVKKEEHKQRISLVLLISLFVFAIIVVAVLLAIAILRILLYFDVITSVDDTLSFGDTFFLVVIISAIIGFFLTFFTSKISLKPVNQIINKLEQLAKGNFKVRIRFSRPFSVNPAFKEVEQSFNTTAQELEHTEMLRSDFINNFSHEFKTPIVSIAGFAKLLRVGNLDNNEKENYLKIIEEESLRLSYMANNVLNLTRVENQTILTNVTRYNLSEQIRSSILVLTDMWTQKELELNIEFDEYMIEANKELLEQTWLNLLNNAIKFSDQGGTITVTISEDNNDIIVSISNQGQTIPEESMDKIFNKFYQADESHAEEGNGIGLAIVKKVVDLHNGQVWAQNKNSTTTLSVALPKRNEG